MSEGNVQLKLQVGLDLAFLRKQLSGIGTSLAGQPLEIDVKFNRQAIASEYRLLNRYLSNKTFRISVETNLKAEIAYADTLQRKLKELSAQKVQNLAGTAATGRAGGFIDEGKFNAYLNRLTKAPLEAVRNALQSSGVQMKAAGKGTVEELRQSILSGLPQVTEDIAKGLTRGLNPKMQESGRKGARSAIDGFKDAAGIASPSKVFKQLGRFSAEGFGIGFFNEFSRFQSRATAQVRQFVGVLSLELARVQVGSIGAGRGMLAGSPRGGGAHMAPIGPLPHGSQEPWAYNQQAFRYEPRLSQPGQIRGGNVPPMRERFPFAAAPSIMGTTSSPSMLGRGFPALPPAGGTAGTREASLALRELAAHGRSAARAASVFAEDAARAAQRSRLQTVSGQMPMGGGGGFLPPRGGVPRGGAPFNGFPSDGMMGPSTTKGQAAIHTLTGSLKDADQYLRQARVPLAGAIEGLGSEFANATKQVLLYGTAYKALAFFMDLPNQALAAATALQTFRNQLNAVTGSSENASRSFGFIDSLADRFAVPLESVRQGFVRMYASMEPAGFGATEIEGLFTGVSKAAATFGMSKDQVDRVTYALSQMASKGQIMAEELRGQLGDVLPGSFALFAEAAQMSIPEFTKAMEQGRFSGEAMRVVLNNVAILLNTKFASGAEGAAKTLQGALNTMGTGMQRLYESFEPLVNEVAQRVFPLIAEAMADASSGVKAFTAAVRGGNPELQQLSGSARQMYAVMQQLAEIARSIGTVLSGLMPTLAGLGKMIIFALEQLARFVNTPVGGYLANLALQAALVTAALQLMAKVGIFAAVRGLIQLIFQTDAAIWKLKLLIKTSAMAKLGLIGLGAAVVISAIMALNNSLDSTNRKLDEMSKRSRQTAQDLMAMAVAGNTASITEELTEAATEAQSLGKSVKVLERVTSDRSATVTEDEFKGLQSKGLAAGLGRSPQTGRVVATRGQLQANLEAARLGWKEALNRQGSAEEALKTAVDRARAMQKPVPLEPIPPGEGDGGGGGDQQRALDQAQRDAERLASQQQQLTIANAELENKNDEFTFATRSQLLDDEFERRKSLVDSVSDYEIAGANEIIGVRLKLEKQLASIRMGAMKTYQDSLRRMEEGRLKIALAERTRTAATAASQIEPSGGAAATGGAIFGDTGRTFNAQGWVHGHFQNMNREALVADTVETVMALLSQGVPTELGSGEKFTQGMSQQQIEEIVRRGIASHKKYESGIGAVDIFVPEGTSVPVPVSGVSNMGGSAGVGGNLARGTQLMHLDPRSTSGGALSGTAFSMARREQKTELSVEAAEAEQAELARRLLSTTETEFSKARDAARVAVAEMLGTVMPVEQLKLENQLLEERGRLMLQSIPEEVIQMEEDRFKAMAKGQQIQSALKTEIEFYEFALDAANKAIKAGGPDLEQYEQLAKQLQKTINGLKDELDGIEPAFNAFNVELAKSTLQALQNADALKAMQETVETIEQAVEGAMSAYKGFAAEVISGGSLKDAASKMQQALKDQAVTMFLDFALKPMEQFMEDGLKKMFGIPSEDEKRKEQIAKLQEQINATKLNTDAINANTAAQGGQAPTSPTANVPGVGNTPTSSLFSMGGLGSQAVNAPMAIDIAALGGASSAIDSLNESVYSMGDAIPSFKDSLGNITDTVYKASEETNAQGATFSENLGKAVGAIGIAATSVMGIAAGIGQIKEGGASNVLGGIGSVLMGIGGAMGGFGKLFPGKAAANGAVWQGGFTAFANGGVVNGPTLGLVGEGKYNEAIVPLPDGRSIPVKMAGGSSARSIMEDNGRSGSSSPSTLSLSFETTKINGVEYVSRDQLELAMAATRKEATREGATRGMNMTIDKIKNSPSTRNSLGMGRR
jgi:tape measure domain-containing protein